MPPMGRHMWIMQVPLFKVPDTSHDAVRPPQAVDGRLDWELLEGCDSALVRLLQKQRIASSCLSVCVWSLARLDFNPSRKLLALSATAMRRFLRHGDVKPQSLGQFMWALSSLRWYDPGEPSLPRQPIHCKHLGALNQRPANPALVPAGAPSPISTSPTAPCPFLSPVRGVLWPNSTVWRHFPGDSIPPDSGTLPPKNVSQQRRAAGLPPFANSLRSPVAILCMWWFCARRNSVCGTTRNPSSTET